MLGILAEKIHDNRFLRLMRNMLKPDTWRTGSGTRRSAGVRKAAWFHPIMSNIYLHKLDEYVETVLIPEYTRGQSQEARTGLRQGASGKRRARKRGDHTRCGSCASSCAACPAGILMIPATGGCGTSRYADDTLLGFAGPKAEAEEIKAAPGGIPA